MATSSLERLRKISVVLLVAWLALGSSFIQTAFATSTLTSSAKTVAASEYDLDYAHSPMPDLRVTVSQTKNLTAQGVAISWTGANAAIRPSSTGGANFFQIFQCWGDDPNHPGHPDRTTCQYGSYVGPGTSREDYTSTDSVDPQDVKYTVPGAGWANPPLTSIPFKSATGENVWDLKKGIDGKLVRDPNIDMSSNQYFSKLNSNEITWMGSDVSGNGLAKFELQTKSQAPGLGCGNPVKTGKKYVGQHCWLVILPRGTSDNRQSYITQSGLFWDAWKHHIAFRLDFRPVGVRCQIGVPERQVQGSELIGTAFSSWQPDLCGGTVNSAFVISSQFDGDALDSASSTTSSPLAITSHALNEQANDPLVYAPLAIGGVSVSFAIDRRISQSMVVPNAVAERNLTPFESLRLTPRLLAKLLTASYKDSMPVLAVNTHLGNNPTNLTADPDFLAVNSNNVDWQYMDLNGAGLSDVLMPNSRSLLAETLWKYILSDSDGRDFMAGKTDPYGMKVNPWYCTDPKINPSGTGFTMPNLGFPKSDPVEKPDTTSDIFSGSGPINLVTWRPYVADFETGAASVLRGQSFTLGGWNPSAQPPGFSKSPRNLPGSQKVLALTTTASAEKYQTLSVSFLNPAGEFVSPTTSSLNSAQAAMVPSANNSNVYEFNFNSSKAKAAKAAYPLTIPVYAALNPLQSDVAARKAYANMINYVVTHGQTPGSEPGELPPGYAPLSSEFVKLAQAAAAKILNGVSPHGTETTPALDPSKTPGSQDGGPSTDGTTPNAENWMTPNNPYVALTASAVQFAGVCAICALIFSPLFILSKRRG